MIDLELLEFHIRGDAPTIMHNGQLANPMNPVSKSIKEISSKRKKSDSDFAELARLEWLGSLYLDEDGSPGWPSENIETMLVSAAKTQKLGKQAKAGLICNGVFPLIYDGPKDPDKLWEVEKFRNYARARVGMASIIRCRPVFSDWELKFEVAFNPEVLNASQIKEFVVISGRFVGLSDWRPKFGRFSVVGNGNGKG